MQDRITLREFAARLQPYRESIAAADDLLGDLDALHQERHVLPVQQRVDLLRALAALASVYDGFLASIEASAQLPLAVIAGRLPLIEALIDAKRQALALAQQFAALPIEPSRLDVSSWWETERAIAAMRDKNTAVGDESRRLLERARFREKELIERGALCRPPASTPGWQKKDER